MRSPWRPLPALVLLLLGGLGAASPAGALDASATTRDRLRVCGPALVRVTWTVRLGSTRVLVVESPIGRFAGAGSRTFGGLLRQEGAVGTVVFSELVTVPADLVRLALESGAPVTLRRRFDVLRSAGPPESVEAVPLRLEVVPPQLTVVVRPPQTTITACEESTLELRWSIVVRDAAPIDAWSERGTLLVGGGEVAAPGGRLAGRVVDRLELSETLRLTPELTAAALARGGGLRYRRRFALRCGDFARSLEASLAIELAGREIAITVAPERTEVAVGRTVPVALRWSALGTAPCVELFSAEVSLETTAGSELARLDHELRLRGGGAASETLSVPAALSRAALDLGVREIEIVREFVLADPTAPLAAGAVTAGAVTAVATTTGAVTAGRVVAKRAARLRLTGVITPEPSVLRLALRFEDGEAFRLVPRGASLKALAEITTAGSGPLRATWELADPTSTSGMPVFRPLRLVARRLAAGGLTVVEVPDLPTERRGLYLLRLRLTAPVADFAVPVLRYEIVPGWQVPTGFQPPSSLPRPPADPPLVEDDDPKEEREVLALSAGLDEAVALEVLGLEVKLRYQLNARWPRDDGKQLVLSVLRVPRGVTVREAVRQIRRGYPGLWVAANDLYTPQQGRDGPGMTIEAAKDKLGWGSEQEQCEPGVKIGTVDLEDHAQQLAEILTGLVHKADVTPRSATGAGGNREDGAGARPGAPAIALGDLIDALHVARMLDRLNDRTLVQFGIAGRSNLILRFIFKYAVDPHMVFVAPFNNNDELSHSYPASSDRVIGVVACAPDSECRPPHGFFAAPKLEKCNNSCAVPFVTAALWLLGAGQEGTSWTESSSGLETLSQWGIARWIKAPPCVPERP